MRYCKTCKKKRNKKTYGVGWGVLTVLGFLLWMLPGIAIFVWRLIVRGECVTCGEKNWR